MKIEDLSELEVKSQFSILCDISMELTSPAPLDEVLEKTGDLLANFFFPDPIRIYLWYEEISKLKLKVQRGLSNSFLKEVQEIALGTGYSGIAIARGKPVGMNVSEFTDGQRKALFEKEGIKSVLAIPLILKGCTMGVLNVASTRNFDFFSDKLDFLHAVGSQISIAINYARLFEERIEQEKLRAALKLEKTLARIQKSAAVGEIVGKVAHELRNSLMVVGGIAQRLMKTSSPSDKKYLKIVLSEISSLETVLSDLDVYNSEKFQPEEVDLNQLINDSIQLFQDKFEKNNITIQKSLDKALPRAFIDLTQIRQVLIPIIKNALEVMPDGGIFSIRTRVDNGFAQYIIEDTGPQIPQSDLIRLYCSFVSGRPRGVGLGLAIIRRIVEANKGTLSIANKEKNGVIIKIGLPVQ